MILRLYSQDMISTWLEEFQFDYPKLCPTVILWWL